MRPGSGAGCRAPDRSRRCLAPEPDGVVIKVVAESGGLVAVDTTGDGVADNGTAGSTGGPLSDAERRVVADLLDPGDTAWRVTTLHFSPHDLNFPSAPPEDAVPPPVFGPTDPIDPTGAPIEDRIDDPTEDEGFGVLEHERQVLREQVPITGAGMSLNYASDRAPGRQRTVRVPISGSSVPESLRRIEVEATVAGRRYSQTFPAKADQEWRFSWDGLDRFGRPVQGRQQLHLTISYVYDRVYMAPPDVAASFGLVPVRGGFVNGTAGARTTVRKSRTVRLTVGGFDPRPLGLGGWTLSPHHTYDAVAGMVLQGDGTRQTGSVWSPVTDTVLGTGEGCTDSDCLTGAPADQTALSVDHVTVAGDGTTYVLDNGDTAFEVTPDGQISHLAGARFDTDGRCRFYSADDAPYDPSNDFASPPCSEDGPVDARKVEFDRPGDLQVMPGGDVLVTDSRDERIYRINPATHDLTVFAGNGTPCYLTDDPRCGDGGQARDASLDSVQFVAVASDGTAYLTGRDFTIRRIDPTGVIHTIAGVRGEECEDDSPCGEGGPSAEARLGNRLMPLAVGPDGSVYLVDRENVDNLVVVRRITPAGTMESVAGYEAVFDNDTFGFDQSGVPASRLALVDCTEGLAVGPDSSVYLPNCQSDEVYRFVPGGRAQRVAGVGPLYRGNTGESGDGAPGPATEIPGPTDVAVGPDGALHIAHGWFVGGDARLRRIEPPLPAFDGNRLVVAAADGTALWVFDDNGRHLKTLDARTGAALLTFAYDADGRLAGMTDGDGNSTTIERDAAGAPLAVVGPFGQRTALSVDDQGWLASAATPAGATTTLTHRPDGLLTQVQGARPGATYDFTYDPQGELTRAADPAGTTTLTRTVVPGGWEVQVTTAEDRTSTYRTTLDPDGTLLRVTTRPDGTRERMEERPDASSTQAAPDGTVTELRLAADPRFGMNAAYSGSTDVTTPGGLQRRTTSERAVVLEDPGDPLSLVSQTTTETVNGRTATSTYDADTRTTTGQTPTGQTPTTVVDGLGRVVRSQDEGLAAVTRSYDGRGRLCRVTTGEGENARTTGYVYETEGTLCAETAGLPEPAQVIDASGQITSFRYDADLRAVSSTDPGGHVLALGYDDQSNQVSVTPPGRSAHLQSFEPRDLRVGYQPPGAPGASVGWAYDDDGQVELLDRPDGTTSDPAYDAAGRLDLRTTDHGLYDYDYDDGGRLSGLTSPDGVGLTRGYDGALLVSYATTGPAATEVRVALDDDLRPIRETVDAGTDDAHEVAYTYDADGRLSRAGELLIGRDATTGLVTSTSLGAVATATTHTGFGEVATHVVTVEDDVVYSASHVYDDLGRRSQTTETVLGESPITRGFTYDGSGRVEQVDDDGVTRAYGYDANGNRVSGPEGQVGSYDERDRIQTYGSRTFTHDAAGDLLAVQDGASSRTFDYDVDGTLHGVAASAGPDITYVTDPHGRRTGRTVLDDTGTPVATTAWAYRNTPPRSRSTTGSATASSASCSGRGPTSRCTSSTPVAPSR